MFALRAQADTESAAPTLFIKASSPVSARLHRRRNGFGTGVPQCGCDLREGMALGKGVAFIAGDASATAKLLVLELRLRLSFLHRRGAQQPPATARSASANVSPTILAADVPALAIWHFCTCRP